MSLTLSRHAEYRIWMRQFSDADIASALCGRQVCKADGSELWIGRGRVTVAIAADGTATTAYRLQRKLLKARYSR